MRKGRSIEDRLEIARLDARHLYKKLDEFGHIQFNAIKGYYFDPEGYEDITDENWAKRTMALLMDFACIGFNMLPQKDIMDTDWEDCTVRFMHELIHNGYEEEDLENFFREESKRLAADKDPAV